MNLKMPALKQALEQAGFSEVKTLLSSDNVVFSTRASLCEVVASALGSDAGARQELRAEDRMVQRQTLP